MREIVAPVGIAVFDEQRSEILFVEPTGTVVVGDVHLECNASFAFHHQTEAHTQEILFACLGMNRHAVELEMTDAVGTVEAEQNLCIALPVGVILIGIGREPKTECNAAFISITADRTEAAWEFFGIGRPEFGITFPKAAVPDAVCDGCGIGGASLLPAVIDLDDVDTHFCRTVDFTQQEFFTDCTVAGAVTPGVGHDKRSKAAAVLRIDSTCGVSTGIGRTERDRHGIACRKACGGKIAVIDAGAEHRELCGRCADIGGDAIQMCSSRRCFFLNHAGFADGRVGKEEKIAVKAFFCMIKICTLFADKGIDVVGAVKKAHVIKSDMTSCMEDSVNDICLRCGSFTIVQAINGAFDACFLNRQSLCKQLGANGGCVFRDGEDPADDVVRGKGDDAVFIGRFHHVPVEAGQMQKRCFLCRAPGIAAVETGQRGGDGFAVSECDLTADEVIFKYKGIDCVFQILHDKPLKLQKIRCRLRLKRD